MQAVAACACSRAWSAERVARCEIKKDRDLQNFLNTSCSRRYSYLQGVGGRVHQLGVEVEEGWLGEAALVQAALVRAEHREAQQVCMTSPISKSAQ